MRFQRYKVIANVDGSAVFNSALHLEQFTASFNYSATLGQLKTNCTFAAYKGVLVCKIPAEMIPNEPDAGNAAVGNVRFVSLDSCN